MSYLWKLLSLATVSGNYPIAEEVGMAGYLVPCGSQREQKGGCVHGC